ncbi:MAG: hypothetical protein RBU37_06825 [Myxococcota bacterium]|nr:hypothetical protein [Myxococcota bacterium]
MMPRELPLKVGLLALLPLCTLLFACEEEPPPKNELPQWIAGSASLSCVDSGNPELSDLVLAGGEVRVIDDNLVGVSVLIGGLETIALQPDALVEEEAAESLQEQRFSFEFDAERRLLCNDGLLVVFTAIDEKGEQIQVSVSPEGP